MAGRRPPRSHNHPRLFVFMGKLWTYKSIVEKYCTGKEQVVGLGSGKTATHLMDFLKDRLRPGTAVVGTSTQSELLVASYSRLPVLMEGVAGIDVYFDGADYVDQRGQIIKGYGGALGLERIAMQMAKQVIIVVQRHKLVDTFQDLFVPVEVVKAALSSTLQYLKNCRVKHSLRTGIRSTVYVTDSGNVIIDVECHPSLLDALLLLPGVVAHGLIQPNERITVIEVEGLLDLGSGRPNECARVETGLG